MIEAEALGRTYGDRVVVQAVDLSVAAGEVVGLLGVNGAGKTTILRMLVGALAPTSGAVRIGGIDLFEAPLRARALVGYLPEVAPVPADAGVIEALLHVARLYRVSRPRAAAEAVAERLGLMPVADRLVGQLSKGWRQRVGLAAALVHAPRAVVLDEPASGLDPTQRVELRGLLRELADAGTAVLMSTHALADVEATCDRVAVLHEGRIALDHDMRSAAAQSTVIEVLRPDGLASALAAVAGVSEVAAAGSRFEVRGGAVDHLAQVAATHGLVSLGRADDLEALFLRVTAGRA